MTFMPGRTPLPPEALEALLDDIMPDKNRTEFREANDTDFAYELGERSRMLTVSGRILQLDNSVAGHTLVLKDSSGKLAIIPYHAVQRIELE